MTAANRTLKTALKRLLRGQWREFRRQFLSAEPASDYDLWRVRNVPTRGALARMQREIAQWPKHPLFCVAWGGESRSAASLASIQAQIYPHWKLCDESEKAAAGSYGVRVGANDRIAPHAFYALAAAINADPTIDVIYSDEDRIESDGRHVEPFFKPDWSPEYYFAWMYTGNLLAARAELGEVEDGLILRALGNNPKIHHIADVLYHRAGPYTPPPAKEALEGYFSRINRAVRIEPGYAPGVLRVRPEIIGKPLVSIVIPSACREITLKGRQTWFVTECVQSIRRLSTYGNIEIIVLDNNDMSEPLRQALEPLEVRVVPFTEEFNLARKMNLGAKAARGEQLILLNDDIEVITPDWIEAMLEFSQWPEIGAVGVQLLYPTGTQQHTGVILLDGNPRHPLRGKPREDAGYFHSSQVHRNFSAVTGACVMTRAEVYKAVGGFSENFPLNYNDVDYCLKVGQTGRRIVYTPHAQLYHYESVSKTGTHAHEAAAFKAVWGEKMARDRYYSPHLGRHFDVK